MTASTGSLRNLLDRLAGSGTRPPVEELSAVRIAATLRAGRALAAVAAGLLLVVHFTNAFVLGHEFTDLDANAEGTALTWASAVATAAVAVAAVVAAVMTGPRVPYVVLACAAAFLSLDDMTELHERISAKMVTVAEVSPTWDSVIWPLVYLPLLVLTAVLILRLTRVGTPTAFRHVVAGLCLLVAAIALEVLTAPWSTGTNLVHTVQGGVEEALELAGWVLIASGVLATMLTNVVRQATAARAP
ncbi:hypothetical protein [Ornithinicoccus halotolerans]|uniref:hypothetical protein n=1 Tax=Ornithinicoccus halotolerans TaxID=1748220 RepID=UPI001294FB7F|nr:hypothetical protein [Ornithinicoccus halotolerans]